MIIIHITIITITINNIIIIIIIIMIFIIVSITTIIIIIITIIIGRESCCGSVAATPGRAPSRPCPPAVAGGGTCWRDYIMDDDNVLLYDDNDNINDVSVL